MPYTHVDLAAFEDLLDEHPDLSPDVVPRPSAGFDYEPAEGTFDPATLAGPVAVVYGLLTECGMTRFRGTYDGGHDEGFAHADTVWFGDDPQPITAVSDVLAAAPGCHARLLEAAREPHGSHWGDAAHVYGGDTPALAVGRALDELADAMASALLGDGYGTGEYELYGAFVVTLPGGRIEDDPAAGPPHSRY